MAQYAIRDIPRLGISKVVDLSSPDDEALFAGLPEDCRAWIANADQVRVATRRAQRNLSRAAIFADEGKFGVAASLLRLAAADFDAIEQLSP